MNGATASPAHHPDNACDRPIIRVLTPLVGPATSSQPRPFFPSSHADHSGHSISPAGFA
jgi:hypothetical protein